MENETMEKKETKVETKLCKHCQSEIPKKAKVCPNCRKKQGGKGKWIAIIVVLLFIFAAASGGDDSSTTNKVGEVETQVSETTGNENQVQTESQEVSEDMSATGTEENVEVASVENEFHVGDIVETPTFKISFLSAQEYTSENEFIQPKDGNVFYRMEFEFENIGSTDQSISSILSWGCYADGYAAEQAYMVGDDQLDATLSTGRKVKGAVYYEVPADAQEIVLEYETNFWTENKVIFVVK